MWGYKSLRAYLLYALFSLGLVTIIYPDIIFLHASLKPSEIGSSHLFGSAGVSNFLGLESKNRNLYHGYNDIGTSVWGLEPGQIFLNKAISSGLSPYWNPQSSAGELGVESMTDSKFSPFSVLVAVSGLSSTAFNFIYLLLLAFNLYFLFLICSSYLHLNIFACLAGGLIFVLNGFHTCNTANILVHPYIFMPFLLHSFLHVRKSLSATSFLQCLLAHIFVLSPVFPPSSIFTIFCSYIICLAIPWWHSEPNSQSRGQYRLIILGAGLISILFLAPILIPLVHSWFYVDTFSQYNTRPNFSVNPLSVISFLSPKHFWESYNSFELHRSYSDAITFIDASRIHHFGIIGVILSLAAFQNWTNKPKQDRVFLLSLAILSLVAVGRAANFFPFTLIDYLPIARAIRTGYWDCMLAICVTFLSATGMQQIWNHRLSPSGYRPALLVTGLCLILTFLCAYHLGIPTYPRAKLYLAAFLAWPVLTTLALYFAARTKLGRTPLFPSLLLFLMFVELFSYINTYRPLRNDRNPTDPSLLPYSSHLSQAGRTISLGRDILPAEWGVAYGVSQVDGFRESVLPWYRDFFYKTFGKPTHDVFFDVIDAPRISLPLSSYLGVRFFIVSKNAASSLQEMRRLGLPKVFEDPKVEIYENETNRPRARLYHNVKAGNLTQDISHYEIDNIAFTQDITFLETVREAGLLTEGGVLNNQNIHSQAEIINEGNSVITVRTSADMPSILSLADTWHPGWSVSIDDSPAYMALINDSFRGVLVPSGRHTVTFKYSPPGHKVFIPSLLGALLVTLLISMYLGTRKSSAN